MALADKVLQFIKEHSLISGQETIIVAVSGGPDSVCLLHLLTTVREKLGIELHAAYLNHMLRGAEAEAEAAYVREFVHALDTPSTIEAFDVASYSREHHLSLEEAAREVRYRFFSQVAKSWGAKRAAVGHTAADQVETILLHLIRGAGTRGLSGMRPQALYKYRQGELIVIRPLLCLSREETEAYCQEHNLTPQRDSSNLSLSYLRNRVRHELLPLLRDYNPNIDHALLRTAAIASDEAAFFEQQVAEVWSKVGQEGNGGIALDKREFFTLHPALKRYLSREVLQVLLGDMKDIEAKHIEAMKEALSWEAGKKLSLPQGLTLTTEYDRCLISRGNSLCPFPALWDDEYPLNIPGETVIVGWRVISEIMPRQAAEIAADGFDAWVDFEAVGENLVLRTRRRGDRFQPYGMNRAKKLQDFMVDAKIPQFWRDSIPLMCSSEEIYWVVGWRISEKAKVEEKTEQVLHLKAIPPCL